MPNPTDPTPDERLTDEQIEAALISLLDVLTVNDNADGLYCLDCDCGSRDRAVAIEHAPDCPITVFTALLDERRQAAELGAWQPIETAPKDGTRVMLCVVGSFERDDREFYHMASWGLDHWQPFIPNNWTHWMPLPAPPRQAAADLAAIHAPPAGTAGGGE